MTNETLEKPERRAPADKFNDRRSELVDAALETLAEFGYARTTLRDIAQNSRFSHGVIHYYFSDKVDLIAYCVRDYKAKCVARYDQIMVDAESYAALVERLAAGLCETIVADGKMHRLWGVRKPTKDGHVTSVEAYDADGDMIIQFFGKRHEGHDERPAWRELVEALPHAAGQNAA